MGQGAAQAPLSFINVSVLRDTLVQLLGLVGGSSAEGAQPTVHGVGIGAQPAAAAPRVEVSLVPVAVQHVMSVEKHTGLRVHQEKTLMSSYPAARRS